MTPPSLSAAPAASRLGLAALLIGAAVIGFSPICVRLSESGPLATGAYRLALSLPILWLWLHAEGRSAPRPRAKSRSDLVWFALAGLFLAGDLGAWHWGVNLTSVANATLFANTAPIWVTLAAGLMLKETIRPGFVAGLGLALAGAALLVGLNLGAGEGRVAGDLFALLAGFFYGCYQIAIKRLRHRFSTASVMFWSSLGGVAPLVVLALSFGETLGPQSLQGWGALIFLAVVVHAGGQSLIGYGFAHLSAAFSSVALLAQPPVAALLGWLFFRESLSPLQLAGGAVVLAGIALAHRYRAQARAAA